MTTNAYGDRPRGLQHEKGKTMIKRFEVSLKDDNGNVLRNRTFTLDMGDDLAAAMRKFKDHSAIHHLFVQGFVIQMAATIRGLMADRKNTDAVLDAAVAKMQPSLGRTGSPEKQDDRAASALARYSEADIARILKLAEAKRKEKLKGSPASAKKATGKKTPTAKKTAKRAAA